MTIYDQFRNSCLDLSALGLDYGPSVSGSSATPPDANILAWLTDSPIHFCQVPALDGAVIAVNPDAFPGEQLLPVANDIPDFIGLLVQCKDAALIAGAHQWSSFRFKELMEAVKPGMKTRSVLRALVNIYKPPVINDPATMMMELRKTFQQATAHWTVGFDSGFASAPPKEQGGKELTVNRNLEQPEGTWYVPSVYLCREGIVVDTALEVSMSQLSDFRDHWDSRSEETLSLADKLQRQLDDPLRAAVVGTLMVNDKPLHFKKSFTAIWNPLTDNSPQVRGILNHYGLNQDKGYLFIRYCFPRKGKYPQIRSLELVLEAEPVPVPDATFTVRKAGEKFRFTNPGTGLEHTFTVLSITNEALNPNFLTNHPCCYTRLNYSLEPSINPGNFRVVDRDVGDRWDDYQDDPVAVIFADRKPDPGRYALSSLRHEPRNDIRWQMVFHRKRHKDMQLKLLP